MPVYYYPSGQYPTSTTQQYRPIASVQYNAQRSQQIPQTAQQAGMYIWYSFLQLLTVPLQVQPVGCALIEQQRRKLVAVLFENTVRITNWETFCLDILSNGRAEAASSIPAVLHAVLLCPQCPCSKWLDTGRAERERGVSSHTEHSSQPLWLPSAMETLGVFVSPCMVITCLQWCRRGQLCSLCCPCPEEQQGRLWVVSVGSSCLCGWKGGRYTVREWVAGLTVNRSLFLLCHATLDHSRVRGDRRRAGLLCVCWERVGVVAVKESSHFKGINNSGVWDTLFIYFLSVSLVLTFPHTVTPGVGGRGGGVGFVFPDVPGRIKHSSLDLSLAETL